MKFDFVFAILGLGLGGGYAMMTLGVVSIYRASGVPNFAQGAVAMFSAYIYYSLRDGPLGTQWSFVVTLAIAAAIGVVFYYGVLRQIRNAPLMAKIASTIALLMLLYGIAILAFPTSSSIPIPILPQNRIIIFGFGILADRFWIVGMAIVLGIILEVIARKTRFGLATRAIAESEKGVVLIGLSPSLLAAANWALACVLAALAGIFISPDAGLNADVLTLLIVPVFAAALIARFHSYVWAVVAAIAIGCIQSILQLHSVAGPIWTTLWEGPGRSDAFPALLIFVILLFSGRAIPPRDEIELSRPPISPNPKHVPLGLTIVAVIGTAMLLVLPVEWVAAASVSITVTIIGCSLVLLTGIAGQISLVQLGFAGIGAFIAAECSTHGVPLIPGVLLGTVVGAGCGLIIGIPSLKIRGQALAIMTLGVALAFNDLVFNNGQLYPPSEYFPDTSYPVIGGWRMTERSFGVACLIILVLALWMTVSIRKSRLGLKALLVRESERSAIIAGINVRRVKLQIFVIASAMAALGGALSFHDQLAFSVSNYTVFGSLLLFCVAYIGGLGMISGAVIAGIGATGGLFSTLLAQWNASNYSTVLAGGLLLIVIQVHPDGVSTLPKIIRERIAGRRSHAGSVSNSQAGASVVTEIHSS